MSEKRYFKIEYDEEWYLFDSTTISEQLVKEQAEYGYGVFANSLSPSEVVDLLNFQDKGIKALRKEVEEKTQMSKLINICNKHKLRIIAQDQEIQIFKNIIKKWLKKCDLLERYIESKGLSEECMKMIKEELED